MVEIIPIALGISRSFVLRGDSCVLVDCGVPNKAGKFVTAIESQGMVPEDIGLIIITHGHSDHVGSARDIKAATGARIAMHHTEARWLENPTMPPPPGVTRWGRLFMSMRRFIMPVQEVMAAHVDILIADEGLSLAEYGIPGRAVFTPGHTMGSLSVVLDGGDAIVGDLAMNMFPLRLTPGLPIFAEDTDALLNSWRKLLDMGVRTVLPSHGKPFPAGVMAKCVRKLSSSTGGTDPAD
jgi:hydroxyacylglutathione hydrolase